MDAITHNNVTPSSKPHAKKSPCRTEPSTSHCARTYQRSIPSLSQAILPPTLLPSIGGINVLASHQLNHRHRITASNVCTNKRSAHSHCFPRALSSVSLYDSRGTNMCRPLSNGRAKHLTESYLTSQGMTAGEGRGRSNCKHYKQTNSRNHD